MDIPEGGLGALEGRQEGQQERRQRWYGDVWKVWLEQQERGPRKVRWGHQRDVWVVPSGRVEPAKLVPCEV